MKRMFLVMILLALPVAVTAKDVMEKNWYPCEDGAECRISDDGQYFCQINSDHWGIQFSLRYVKNESINHFRLEKLGYLLYDFSDESGGYRDFLKKCNVAPRWIMQLKKVWKNRQTEPITDN